MLHVSKYPNVDKGLKTTIGVSIVTLAFGGKQDHRVSIRFLTATDAEAFYDEIKNLQSFRALTLLSIKKKEYSYLLVIDNISADNKMETFCKLFPEEVIIDVVSTLPETRDMDHKLMKKTLNHASNIYCVVNNYNMLLSFKHPEDYADRCIISITLSDDQFSGAVLNLLTEKNIGHAGTLHNTFVNDIQIG